MPYIGTSPSNSVRRVHTYTATASQTTFTGASSEGVTLSYVDTNYIDVFQNGVLLGSADYTSTSGTSVVLAQGASADDLIVIVVYDVFSVADTVSKTNGGSFDSGVTMSSTLDVTGALSAKGGAVFNEDSADVDFRVESDTKSHAFFMEGSNGRIVINAADATGQSSHCTLLFESASYSAFAGRMTDNGSGAGFLVCRKSDGSTIGQVARNGTSDAVQFLTSSDYRLKENVSYNFDATAKLKQLKPCTFTWINDESNTTYQGFLAHEVQDIVPHAVNGAKDAVDADGNIEAQSIDKSDIVPLLVKTIQELEARITALENAE